MTNSADHVLESDVARELAILRKGPGLRHPNLARRVGSTLRRLFSISASDSYASAAANISAAIEALSDEMDTALFMTLACEMNMLPDCKFSTLGERQGWLAEYRQKGHSTVRAQGVNAIDVAASILVERNRNPRQDHIGYDLESFVRTSFYGNKWIEAIRVQYRIKSLIDGLDHITREHQIKRNASVKVGFQQYLGCHIEQVEYRPSGMVVCRVDLPKKLQAGESHTLEYKLVPMESGLIADPHILFWTTDFTPKIDIIVKFDPANSPIVAWKVDGLSGVVSPGDTETCRRLQIDRYSSTEVSFEKTSFGRSYGLAWKWHSN